MAGWIMVARATKSWLLYGDNVNARAAMAHEAALDGISRIRRLMCRFTLNGQERG
jgi:hypothetical protein